MKKFWKFTALFLLLVALLGTSALAAEKTNDKLTVTESDGATVTLSDATESFELTYKNDALVNGNQYLVLMVTGTVDDYTINESSILYIDQTTAAEGAVTFNVYPSAMQNSVVLITGLDGATVVAKVDLKYLLGDVNSDGQVNGKDALRVLKYAAKLISLDSTELLAADFNGDGKVNGADALRLLKYAAGIKE